MMALIRRIRRTESSIEVIVERIKEEYPCIKSRAETLWVLRLARLTVPRLRVGVRHDEPQLATAETVGDEVAESSVVERPAEKCPPRRAYPRFALGLNSLKGISRTPSTRGVGLGSATVSRRGQTLFVLGQHKDSLGRIGFKFVPSLDAWNAALDCLPRSLHRPLAAKLKEKSLWASWRTKGRMRPLVVQMICKPRKLRVFVALAVKCCECKSLAVYASTVNSEVPKPYCIGHRHIPSLEIQTVKGLPQKGVTQQPNLKLSVPRHMYSRRAQALRSGMVRLPSGRHKSVILPSSTLPPLNVSGSAVARLYSEIGADKSAVVIIPTPASHLSPSQVKDAVGVSLASGGSTVAIPSSSAVTVYRRAFAVEGELPSAVASDGWEVVTRRRYTLGSGVHTTRGPPTVATSEEAAATDEVFLRHAEFVGRPSFVNAYSHVPVIYSVPETSGAATTSGHNYSSDPYDFITSMLTSRNVGGGRSEPYCLSDYICCREYLNSLLSYIRRNTTVFLVYPLLGTRPVNRILAFGRSMGYPALRMMPEWVVVRVLVWYDHPLRRYTVGPSAVCTGCYNTPRGYLDCAMLSHGLGGNFATLTAEYLHLEGVSSRELRQRQNVLWAALSSLRSLGNLHGVSLSGFPGPPPWGRALFTNIVAWTLRFFSRIVRAFLEVVRRYAAAGNQNYSLLSVQLTREAPRQGVIIPGPDTGPSGQRQTLRPASTRRRTSR